jgi:hypothetical protein
MQCAYEQQAAAPHRNAGQLARQRARRSTIHVQDRLAWQRAQRCASGAASQHASGAASNAGTAVPDDRLKLCAGELPNGTSDADGSSARPCVQDCKNASMRARAPKRLTRSALTARAAAELAQHARCCGRAWLSQGAQGTGVAPCHSLGWCPSCIATKRARQRRQLAYATQRPRVCASRLPRQRVVRAT